MVTLGTILGASAHAFVSALVCFAFYSAASTISTGIACLFRIVTGGRNYKKEAREFGSLWERLSDSKKEEFLKGRMGAEISKIIRATAANDMDMGLPVHNQWDAGIIAFLRDNAIK
jgi:hypothetical protein